MIKLLKKKDIILMMVFCFLYFGSCCYYVKIKSNEFRDRRNLRETRALQKENLEIEILREKLKNLKESNENANDKSSN